MTSTNINMGLNEGSKPSSKVLRPPGGISSDIFGTGTVAAPVASPARGRAPPSNNIFGGYEEPSGGDKPKHNRLASNVFSGQQAEPAAPGSAHKNSNVTGGEEANKSDEEKDKENGEEDDEEEAAQNNNNSKAPPKGKDVSNPITGETKNFSIGGAGETVGRPSTRVHHPPGGASTPLW